MAKLSSTDIYGDLYVDGIISGVLNGSVSNNLIVKLNGGTTEGTNQFTFNGSAAKTVNITPSAIGAAASSHNHGLLHDSYAVTISDTTTDNGWSMINSSYNGFILKSLRMNANAPGWLCNNYSAGIAFGGADTKGVISCHYDNPNIKFAGGNGSKPVWNLGIVGTSGTTYDLNRINTAYTHSTAAHAPSNAQKNSDITKAEIEAKLTGAITTHTHSYAGSGSAGGAANSAQVLNSNSRLDYNWNGMNYFNINGTAGNGAKTNDTPTTAWWHVLRANHANASGYYTDIAIPFNAASMYYKRILAGAVQDGGWVKLLDVKNFTSHVTPAAIGASASGHTHNAIVSRGNVTCESGVAARPAVAGLSMSQAYNNGYPSTYGNVINLRGTGDGQLFIGWSGTDGAHAPVYVRSKRDNTTSANWSPWAQIYTSANPQTTMNGLSLWRGTQAQYDALSSKSATTVYLIKE